jgi:predicted O-linked N-acetylglucosamine transferase (SPINDLY family)
MGVPTLNMVGETIASQVGISILSLVGLQKFATINGSEFVNEGIFWSENLTELAEIRANLRNRINRSSLSDPNLIGAYFVKSMQFMWRHWCSGLQPESFTINK